MLDFMKKSVRSDFYYRLLMLHDKKITGGIFYIKNDVFYFSIKIIDFSEMVWYNKYIKFHTLYLI